LNIRQPLTALILATATFLAAAPLQKATNASSTAPVFGATTRLVQVNVVAHDKQGRPVTDLRQDEVELFEEGKQQTISVFMMEESKPLERPSVPTEVFSNQFTASNAARSGYTLILLDWLNSNFGPRHYAKEHILRLLKKVEPRDLVALCILERDRGLRVLHDFTADRAQLVKRIAATNAASAEASVEDPDTSAGGNGGPLDIGPGEISPAATTNRLDSFIAARRVVDTLNSFEQIASYLASVPGRKSLIWLTAGFPTTLGFEMSRRNPGDQEAWSRAMSANRFTFGPEMDRAVRRFNDADIAVYPVDARGLIPGGWKNIASMQEIASRTGGRAYYHRNDLDNAIRSALDDSRISYTLGYYPTDSKDDRDFRAIRVKVRRSGVELRYRRRYQPRTRVATEGKPQVKLQNALTSPLNATAIPLRIKAKKNGEKLLIELVVDPSALLLEEENGRHKGKLSLFFAFRPEDKSGRLQAEAISREVDLPEPIYEQVLKQGLFLRKEMAIPQGATSLRIIARDERADSLGSVTVPLAAIQ
jgi:VWFA-related protein